MSPTLRTILAGLVLFVIFFLPGYLWQPLPGDAPVVLTTESLLRGSLWRLPAILTLFVLLIAGDREKRPLWGWRRPRAKELSVLPIVLFLTMGVGWLLSLGNEAYRVDISWPTSIGILALVTSSLTSALVEELFFRSWLLSRLTALSISPLVAGGFAVVLFSIGHLWQGWSGFLLALTSASLYTIWFFWKPNILLLVTAHGLHNALALILAAGA